MNEDITPIPEPEVHTDAPDAPPPIVEPLSLTDKFVGIFTEPTATYQNIREAGPQTSDWLVPVLAFIVILAAGTVLRFANPEFIQQVKQQQIETLQKQVEKGAIKQEQMDEGLEQMEKFGGIQKIIAPVGAAIGFFVVFFLIVLIYWLLARFAFKGRIEYTGMMAIIGLSLYIGIIDQLLSILLMYVTGKPITSLSPALFMGSDLHLMQQASYRFLTNLNPISVWSYVVVSIGIHQVAQITKAKAYGMVFGLWLLWVILATTAAGIIPGMG
jgi:hypothetical protein